MLWRETGTYDLMKSPIFIIGNPRSGTTLLRLMLTCHQHIVIPPECGYMIWWYEKYKDWKGDDSGERLNNFLDDLFISKKFETWNLQRKALKEFLMGRDNKTYPDLVSSIYEYYGRQLKDTFKRW